MMTTVLTAATPPEWSKEHRSHQLMQDNWLAHGADRQT